MPKIFAATFNFILYELSTIMVLMQPQQNSGQYDFFMNPENAPKRSLLPSAPGGDSSFGKRIVVILGGAVLLLIVGVVISSLLSGGGGNTSRLLTVAEDQTELVRVATLGTTSATATTTQNFSQSCALSIQSAQLQLTSFISSHGGGKPSSKTLALKQNSATDTALSNATASSSFDATYTSIMQTQLSAYKNDLNTAYKNANNSSEKQLLSSDYNDAQLLVQELNSPDQ